MRSHLLLSVIPSCECRVYRRRPTHIFAGDGGEEASGNSREKRLEALVREMRRERGTESTTE